MQGIMFSSNSFLKDKVKVLDKTEGIKNALDFICGGLSGIISKTAVMPFDLIRKRLQVQGPTLNHYGSSIPKAPSSSFILTGIYIARTEGILALYKGLTMALIKAAPSSAITFFVFGISSRYFNKN